MYTDSHCHLSGIESRGENLEMVFQELARRKYAFVLDAGTRSNDLPERLLCIERAKKVCPNTDFLVFSAGIWPDAKVIGDRFNAVAELTAHIETALKNGEPLVALGECGLDRHWNKDNDALLKGEEELFELQIAAAKKFALPLIVHSRDAYAATAACLKNAAYAHGVIHCFSYGKKEAAVFLDAGWHISLSGSITYAKKNAAEELLRYIPKERLLIETDAPYLAPVPFRGKINTPLLIEHTYAFCADCLQISVTELVESVSAVARSLFLFPNRQ